MSTGPRSRSTLVRLAALIALAIVVAACGAASSPPPSASAVPSVASVATAVPTPSAPPAPTSSPAPTPAFPVTIVDDQGNSLTIASEPRKIVSLTPAATEILFRLGAGPRTVAKAEDIDPYPPEADALPIVSKFTGVDVEKVVSLEADLVIADTLNPPDAITQLRGLGLPVIVLGATSIDGALKDIELVGAAIGADGEARSLTASMRARFDQLAAATSGLPKPRTFYEIGAGDTIYTVPDPSIYAEMLRLAGADPITTDSSYVISLEKLLAADPEVILLGDQTPVADVPSRPGWAGMTAVRTGAIVAVNDTIVTRPGPRLVDGLEALIKAIHPDVTVPSAAPAAGASAAP